MRYQLIVGLGNPGGEYATTRHNVGFRVVDGYALRHRADAWQKDRRLKGELCVATPPIGRVRLLKPTTFMNESGYCLQKVCSYYKIPPEEVVVVYDEINLEPGRIKLSLDGSAGGHNGVKDILAYLPPRFARLRVGVGGKPEKEADLASHVLSPFAPEEESLVSASLDSCLDSLDLLLREGPELAMNQINRKQKTHDSNSI